MEQKERKSIKGIRIQNASIIMILISCLIYILLILATVRVSEKYEDVHHSMDDYIAWEEGEALLTEGSAYLTEQVRLYVVTKDTRYRERYFMEVHVTGRREQALRQLEEHEGGEEAYKYLEGALESSNELMAQELYAMKLVSTACGEKAEKLPEMLQEIVLEPEDQALSPEKMLEKAQTIVFGESYQKVKDKISQDVSDSLASIHAMTHQNMLESADELAQTMNGQGRMISVLFVQNLLIFLMIILLIVKPLRNFVRCIKEDRMMEVMGSYELKYLAMTYNDMYEVNMANEAMLRYQAEHDPLTGIINRGAFEELKKVFQIKKIPLALLIVDVDKFKDVNDGYGHEAGDQVLKKVAELLQDGFRATDYPARIGGDEFAVLLTNMTEEQKSVIERKIGRMNEILTHPEDGLPKVSLSVGAAFSKDGFTEDLYKKADLALYEVKEHGRCGLSFYQNT